MKEMDRKILIRIDRGCVDLMKKKLSCVGIHFEKIIFEIFSEIGRYKNGAA